MLVGIGNLLPKCPFPLHSCIILDCFCVNIAPIPISTYCVSFIVSVYIGRQVTYCPNAHFHFVYPCIDIAQMPISTYFVYSYCVCCVGRQVTYCPKLIPFPLRVSLCTYCPNAHFHLICEFLIVSVLSVDHIALQLATAVE